MNIVSSRQLLDWVQEYHKLHIPLLESTPSLKRSLQSSDLPCAMLRFNDANHSPQSTESGVSERNIDVLVYVTPEGQLNEAEEKETQVLALFDLFISTYFNHRMITRNVWIKDEFTDSGIVVIDFGGVEYLGFVVSLTITISNQKVNYTN